MMKVWPLNDQVIISSNSLCSRTYMSCWDCTRRQIMSDETWIVRYSNVIRQQSNNQKNRHFFHCIERPFQIEHTFSGNLTALCFLFLSDLVRPVRNSIILSRREESSASCEVSRLSLFDNLQSMIIMSCSKRLFFVLVLHRPALSFCRIQKLILKFLTYSNVFNYVLISKLPEFSPDFRDVVHECWRAW